MAEPTAGTRGPGAWPWIGGIVVLALLIWGITRLLDTGAPVSADAAPAPAARP